MNPVHTVTVFDVGGIYEENEWQLVNNERVQTYEAEHCTCPHLQKLPEPEDDGRFTHYVPRTIRAVNEGGYNCTYVCLDCILAALEK